MEKTILKTRHVARAFLDETARPLTWEQKVQLGADMLGLIPVLGIPAEVLSGLLSLRRGDYVGLGLSLAGLVPVEGEWAAVLKLARTTRQLGHAAGVTAEVSFKVARTARRLAVSEAAASRSFFARPSRSALKLAASSSLRVHRGGVLAA